MPSKYLFNGRKVTTPPPVIHYSQTPPDYEADADKLPSQKASNFASLNSAALKRQLDALVPAEVPTTKTFLERNSTHKHKFASPVDLFNFLNEYVVEQYDAKKILSVSVYNHYCRLRHNRMRKFDTLGSDGVTLDKSNILMIGPSGCGKTLLAKTVTNFLKVPFALCDSTTLTQAGYVGDDVESILFRLLQNADFDVERAERGIVFIDEIDKIAKKKGAVFTSGRDVAGEGVQQALLKLLEGASVDVPNKSNRKVLKSDLITVDTTNILFILSGAFVDLGAIVEARISAKNKTLGFSVENSTTACDKGTAQPLPKIENTDLIEFGFIPEFLGRAPVIAALQPLSERALVAAMTEPKNSLLAQYQALFRLNGIELRFTLDALTEIAVQAQQRQTGARGLRSIFEEILLPAMFEAPGSDVRRVIVDATVARRQRPPILLRR